MNEMNLTFIGVGLIRNFAKKYLQNIKKKILGFVKDPVRDRFDATKSFKSIFNYRVNSILIYHYWYSKYRIYMTHSSSLLLGNKTKMFNAVSI